MDHKVKVIFETTDALNDGGNKLVRRNEIIAGKMAGICYMPDDYASNGIQDSTKAFKRAEGTAKSGHYSTYEHGHITLLIETSKMMAMVLNSLRLYSTSEKSARYTMMKPETELEEKIYNKWIDKFSSLIKIYYGDTYTDKEIEKLAIENARYMISVFTPTTLAYTVPFDRLILTIQWLKDFANTIIEQSQNTSFYVRLAKEAHALSEAMFDVVSENGISPINLEDHKNIGITFISDIGDIIKNKEINEGRLLRYSMNEVEYFGNVYTTSYHASFAALAQLQRHRTIHYEMEFFSDMCYIPRIITNTPCELEWKKDFRKLLDHGVTPQGLLVRVTEEGRFEDWVLKAKERLCSRAQLEICSITADQAREFAMRGYDNLSKRNKIVLASMMEEGSDIADKGTAHNYRVCSRCQFKGYTCKEPCKVYRDGIIYDRIV